MKAIEKYKSMGLLAEDSVFEYLLSTLKDTILPYNFFVAWGKVLGNVSKVEVSLNILNSLIGKDDLNQRLTELIKQYPEVVPVISILIAVRKNLIKVSELDRDIVHTFQKKKAYTDEEIESIVLFAEKCGLLKILSDKNVKSLVDYVVGIEVGLDSNARKNRSGKAMESLTEVYVKEICQRNNYRYLTQATVAKIKSEFGKTVATDKSARKYDFAIDTGAKIHLIEANYYGGGGSKLKSVAGEFKSLFSLVKNDETQFIWVTDGQGWHTAKHPLSETFHAIDFVMNIKMIEDGVLEEIITKGL